METQSSHHLCIHRSTSYKSRPTLSEGCWKIMDGLSFDKKLNVFQLDNNFKLVIYDNYDILCVIFHFNCATLSESASSPLNGISRYRDHLMWTNVSAPCPDWLMWSHVNAKCFIPMIIGERIWLINDLMKQKTVMFHFVRLSFILSIGGDQNLTTITTLPSMCKLSYYCDALIIM